MGEGFSTPRALKPVKGAKIEIEVSNIVPGRNNEMAPEFYPEETILGEVWFKIEKPYKAKSISVGFCGFQEFHNHEDKSTSKSELLYNLKVTLAEFENDAPPVGEEQVYPFAIKVPPKNEL